LGDDVSRIEAKDLPSTNDQVPVGNIDGFGMGRRIGDLGNAAIFAPHILVPQGNLLVLQSE
jgi:hypothetical protein